MKKRTLGFTLLLAIWAFYHLSSPAPVRAGYRIVNVVDDFVAYHQAAREGDAARKLELWDSMLEAKHRAFFDDAIYRRKKGQERERYKAWCQNTFWREIAPEMGYYQRLNQGLAQTTDQMVREVRKHLPDFQPSTDFYLTFSFSFRGKAVGVGGRDVLALGLEFFRQSGDQAERQIRITLAHEMFHLYHFRFFTPSGGLYRPLWAEGLATFASAVVVPGFRSSVYLGFPGAKMNRCHDLLPALAADLKKRMGQNDHRIERIYFGAEENGTKVPPEAGYYVGFMIVGRLAQEYSLAKMARMDKDSVFRLLASELDRLAGSGS